MKYGKSDKGYFISKAGQQEMGSGSGMQGSMSGGPGDEQLKNSWNSYVSWLDNKRLKASPGDLSIDMLDQYNAEMQKQNPNHVPITKQDIDKIQGILKGNRVNEKKSVATHLSRNSSNTMSNTSSSPLDITSFNLYE